MKNERIKPADTKMELSAQHVQEIHRCMYGYKDPKLGRFLSGPVYFCRNYVRIQHPRRGDLPFEMYDYQERMINAYLNNNKVVVLAARQVGKEQPHYSKIATPEGWTTMGDIKAGDKVLTPDGTSATVLMKHPQGKKDVYRVTFDDGSFADCGIDHLWKCYIRNKCVKKDYGWCRQVQEQVISTREMIQHFEHNKTDDNFSICIPVVQSVNFNEQQLPLDPYTLGALLGDGALSGKIKQLSLLGMTSEENFIPEIYLRSSIQQRMELLQGLMDTDDTSSKRGENSRAFSYTTTSPQLRDDVQHLVWSLGGKCSIYERTSQSETHMNYDLTILLPCKKDHLYLKYKHEDVLPITRTVVDIKLIGQEQSSCISIDHPERLYITDNFTVTHNTVVAQAFLLWYACFNPNKTILIAANKNDNAMEIIGKIQYGYEYLPMWLKPGVKHDGWNKHEIKFDNDSRIVSTATSENSGRGMSISLLFLDEFAFIAPQIQEKFWTSILPTLSTGGSAIITSTPNGAIDKFASIWRAANMENNTDGLIFAPVYVAWNEPPGRDEKFKREHVAMLGELKWKQEYECVGGDTKVTIKDPTGNIFDMSMVDLYKMLNK
jgi:hypothetical protein